MNLIRIGCMVLSIFYGVILTLYVLFILANDYSILELMDIVNQLYLPSIFYCIEYNKSSTILFFIVSIYTWTLYAVTYKIIAYFDFKG